MTGTETKDRGAKVSQTNEKEVGTNERKKEKATPIP